MKRLSALILSGILAFPIGAHARFTQADTWIGVDQQPITLNKYTYANVDPANMTDPTGNFSMLQLSLGLAVGGSLLSATTSQYAVFGSSASESIGSTAVHISLGEKPELGEIFETCFSEIYGEFDEVVMRAIIATGAIPIYKPWAKMRVIGNASKFTNFISATGHWKFRGANLPFRVLGTNRAFGAAGRANIALGSGFVGYDLTTIALCVNQKI